jgi:hypothetical protein
MTEWVVVYRALVLVCVRESQGPVGLVTASLDKTFISRRQALYSGKAYSITKRS